MICSFCEKSIGDGHGLISVSSDGTISYYCNSKCERNAKIRLPKRVRWTGVHRKRKADNKSK